MSPLFPFYGSKWRDAKRYPAPSAHVVEPFAGSAGYSSYWEPARVTLVDADPIIVGVWSYLIAATTADILSLPDVEVGQDVREMGLPEEAAWLLGFWVNRGCASPARTRTAYSARTERGQLVWGDRARRRIASEVHKVNDWKITLGDYTTAPADPDATYFVDPPYVDKGRYVNTVDHAALGAWCQAGEGDFIVCEQFGADWLPFRDFAVTKSTRGVSREVTWLSPGLELNYGQLALIGDLA